MSAASLVLTFLGGSAVGAVGAAGVTAWHNSTERLRERMSASAESFLVAVEEVRSAMRVVSAAARELVEAKDEAAEATRTILAFDVDAAGAGEQELRLIQQATGMSRRFEAIVGQHNPLDTTRRAEAALLLEDAQNAVQALFEEPDSPLVAELAPVLREYVRTQARLVTALQGQGDTALLFTTALYRVHASEARVALNFPTTGAELSEVAARADTLKQLAITAHAALHDSTRSDAKPGPGARREDVPRRHSRHGRGGLAAGRSSPCCIRQNWERAAVLGGRPLRLRGFRLGGISSTRRFNHGSPN